MERSSLSISRFKRIKQLFLEGKEDESWKMFQEAHDNFKASRQAFEIVALKTASLSRFHGILRKPQKQILEDMLDLGLDPKNWELYLVNRVVANDRARASALLLRFLLTPLPVT